MKHLKIISAVAALFLAANVAVAVDVVVTPEAATPIALSNTDINRIVCANGQINDVYFSEEKGLKVSYKGANAFVKYLIKVEASTQRLVTQSTEIIVVCGGEVYTLIAQPQKIDTVTVRLTGGAKKRVKDNLTMLEGIPLEQRVITLIQAAYRDEIPESFIVTNEAPTAAIVVPQPGTNRNGRLFEEIESKKRRTVKVDGLGLSLTEYVIVARKKVELKESEFLLPDFGSSIIGVSMDPLQLDVGQSGRLFIVEKGGQ